MRRSTLNILDQASAPAERKDAQRNRQRILAAARKLLLERPMTEICMDALAEEAGVGKGTLYRRFKDRSSLCVALLDEATRAFQDETIHGLGLPPDASAEARLDAFVRALVCFTMDHAALLAEARTWASARSTQLSHPAHTWITYELARLMQLCGQPAREAELLSHWVFTTLDPQAFILQLAQGFSRGEIMQSARSFVLRGIKR